MKKNILFLLCGILLILLHSNSVKAAPMIMDDGTIFDPEYYYRQYNDIHNAYKRSPQPDVNALYT